MKKTDAWIASLGLLCLLAFAPLGGPAAAADMPSGMSAAGGASGGTSETSVVSATSVSGGSGFGGMGGSSEETRTVSHARSTTTSTTGYDALDLTVANAPAQALTVGGVALELTLTAENGEALSFTPTLTHLQSAPAAGDGDGSEPSGQVNALVLTAPADATGQWQFSGSVLRKLHNSGVAWLAFQEGERLTALPTEGFLGGYRYDRWRSSGIAAKDIGYAVTLGALPPQITAAAGGETYSVPPEKDGMLYSAGIYSNESGVNNLE